MKKINKVKIRINGKIFNLKTKMTLKDVIIKYKIPLKKVAIELNKKIVNKQQLGIIKIKKFDKIEIKLIFLDCDLNKLLGRFNETRRIHPLSGSKSLSEALVEEMEYLNPIKEFSYFIIDTTDYSPTDLREELLNYMSISEIEKFSILLQLSLIHI